VVAIGPEGPPKGQRSHVAPPVIASQPSAVSWTGVASAGIAPPVQVASAATVTSVHGMEHKRTDGAVANSEATSITGASQRDRCASRIMQ
jgi:hypothetical protein